MINVFIKTYGCQANIADSQNLKKYLGGLGCAIIDKENGADLILINTCAIRDKAEQKLFSYIGELADVKKENPYLKIGAIGCVATYREQELLDRFNNIVSFVFSAKEDIKDLKILLTDVVEKLSTQKQLYGQLLHSVRPACSRTGTNVSSQPFKRSMINIMRGCNNFCSYCIVPFTKGRERSFSMSSILNSVRKDVESGIKEVTLIGQNVDSYKDPVTGASFATLLKNVALIPGEFWIRFVSPHPKDMTTDVMDVMVEYPEKLCALVHFPVQSGSNNILHAMNRTYTIEKYMDQISQIKKRLPHVTITTDIIVGFPGETEDDYLATRKVMDDVRFDMVFSFIYSPREFTRAASFPDNCSKEVKQSRLEALQARHREISTNRNRRLIGKRLRVLIEKKLDDERYFGRTEGNVRVFVTGKNIKLNSFISVRITDGNTTRLDGVLAD